MPRFYFDVREGPRFFFDAEGTEHPDIGGAEQEASEVAATLCRDRLPKGDLRTIIVELRNEHSQRVITATASLTVERVDPEPTTPVPPE